jgi:hypothetical protein
VCNNRGHISTGNPKGRLLVPSFSLVVPRVPCLREEELYMADKSEIDQKLAEAGWEPDGTFSEHLAIGESGEMCVLVRRSTWETDEPSYELFDAERHVSYWVHEIPTPEQAAKLLEEHGETPEEE